MDTKDNSKIFLSEDRAERIKRREERRQEKREEKFKQGDFNLDKFISALETLKNSIVSQVTDCTNRLSTKELTGDATAKKYYKIFSKHLEMAGSLLTNAKYKKERGEGKFIEDSDAKEAFREDYNQLKEDFNKSLEEYNKEITAEEKETREKIKYKEISDPLADAEKYFSEATALFSNLGLDKKFEEFSGGSSSGSSVIKIVKDIKSGTTPTGENADITKKVFALICEKWKDSKTLTATTQWKKSIFCTPKGLIIGPNRTACIKALKAAYGIKDESGNITQALVDELQKSEVIKESINFTKLNERGMVLSFSDFLSKKSSFNEGVDMEALKKSLESSEGSSGSKSKDDKPKVSWESPFKDREEGNKFRAWVNETDPTFAKEINLDKEGSHTNSYIKKAWEELGDLYKKSSKTVEIVSDKKEMPEEEWKDLKDNLEGFGTIKLTKLGGYALTPKDTKFQINFYKNRRVAFIEPGKEDYKGTLSKNGQSIIFKDGKKISLSKYLNDPNGMKEALNKLAKEQEDKRKKAAEEAP